MGTQEVEFKTQQDLDKYLVRTGCAALRNGDNVRVFELSMLKPGSQYTMEFPKNTRLSEVERDALMRKVVLVLCSVVCSCRRLLVFVSRVVCWPQCTSGRISYSNVVPSFLPAVAGTPCHH
jgi:hypothetical protein